MTPVVVIRTMRQTWARLTRNLIAPGVAASAGMGLGWWLDFELHDTILAAIAGTAVSAVVISGILWLIDPVGVHWPLPPATATSGAIVADRRAAAAAPTTQRRPGFPKFILRNASAGSNVTRTDELRRVQTSIELMTDGGRRNDGC